MSLLSLLSNNPEYILIPLFLLSLIIYVLLRYPIYRLSPTFFQQHKNEEKTSTPLSVVIVTHNNGPILQKNLSAIASQNYPEFEVIVVNDASTDETSDVLKLIEQKYPNVRHTFTPLSARAVSHSKLAITLGVRAAKNDWIVLTEGSCYPKSSKWLSSMATACTDNKDFVLGYSNFEHYKSFFNLRISFNQLLSQLRFFHSVGKKGVGRAVGANSNNIAFRRSVLQNKGFYGNLRLLGGEDLLFIDNAAQINRCAVVCNKDSFVYKEAPFLKQTWHTYQLFEMEAANYLSPHARWERKLWGLSSFCWYLSYFSAIVIIVHFTLIKYYFPAFSVFLVLLCEEIISSFLISSSAKAFEERKSAMLLFFRNLIQPFYTLYYKVSTIRNRKHLFHGEI